MTNWKEDRDERNKAIDSELAECGLTLESVFVPFSQSRNKEEKSPSLNWRVSLLKHGHKILTTDYMSGCAHCPSHKQVFGKKPYDIEETIRAECETGFAHRFNEVHDKPLRRLIPKNAHIVPLLRDVVYSLVQDSSVLDHSTFESWAGEYGYDSDSRNGKKIYSACLTLALKMRAGLGEKVLAELRDLFQDY